MKDQAERVALLEAENAALRRIVEVLHGIGSLVHESLELEPTVYAVLTGVTAGVGLGLNRAALFLLDERGRRQLRGVAAVGPMDPEEADRAWKSIEADAPDLRTLYAAGLDRRDHPGPLDRAVRASDVVPDGDSPVALALQRAALVQAEGRDDLGGLLHVPTCIAAPLRGREGVRGVLYADNRFSDRPVDPVTALAFTKIADHAGRAIEAAREYERVARQARTDALTGLGHHGAMREATAAAVSEARERGAPFGLAMIDLDDFKQVNDRLGHLAGDALLAGVAARLRAAVRGGESVFRYGGEEFAVLLRDAGADELAAIGERLRRAIAERPYQVSQADSVRVTGSVGVAAFDAAMSGASALIEAADRALLRAKAEGKNRVVLG